MKINQLMFVENGVRRIKRRLWWLLCVALRMRKINAYLRNHSFRKLQIGAGHGFLEGWLNTDYYPIDGRFVYLDATKRFPYPDSTFDYIFSEHQIEHLSYRDGEFMLGECFRVLKPGGRLRVCTPNLETVLRLYDPGKTEIQERYIRFAFNRWISKSDESNVVRVINDMFRNWGHQFIYDRDTLQKVMETAGFLDCTSYAAGESDDPNLKGVDRHGLAIGDEMNRVMTLVMEARRPEN